MRTYLFKTNTHQLRYQRVVREFPRLGRVSRDRKVGSIMCNFFLYLIASHINYNARTHITRRKKYSWEDLVYERREVVGTFCVLDWDWATIPTTEYNKKTYGFVF